MLIGAKLNSITGMYGRALVEEVGHWGHSLEGCVLLLALFSFPLCFHGCLELSGSNPSWLLCKNALLHHRPENRGPSRLLANPRRGFPFKEVQIFQNRCRNRVKLQKYREN